MTNLNDLVEAILKAKCDYLKCSSAEREFGGWWIVLGKDAMRDLKKQLASKQIHPQQATPSNPGFEAGDRIRIAGMTPSDYNGMYTIAVSDDLTNMSIAGLPIELASDGDPDRIELFLGSPNHRVIL